MDPTTEAALAKLSAPQLEALLDAVSNRSLHQHLQALQRSAAIALAEQRAAAALNGATLPRHSGQARQFAPNGE